jgi:hypothetical protein
MGSGGNVRSEEEEQLSASLQGSRKWAREEDGFTLRGACSASRRPQRRRVDPSALPSADLGRGEYESLSAAE